MTLSEVAYLRDSSLRREDDVSLARMARTLTASSRWRAGGVQQRIHAIDETFARSTRAPTASARAASR